MQTMHKFGECWIRHQILLSLSNVIELFKELNRKPYTTKILNEAEARIKNDTFTDNNGNILSISTDKKF